MWIKHRGRANAYSNTDNIMTIIKDQSDLIAEYVDGSRRVLMECADATEATATLETLMVRLQKS